MHAARGGNRNNKRPLKVDSVTFLVTVNDTWYPVEYNKTCMATVRSPALKPGVKYNETMQIHVEECDHGPLMFTLSDDGTFICNLYSLYTCMQDISPYSVCVKPSIIMTQR